jgi:hypothetical protein
MPGASTSKTRDAKLLGMPVYEPPSAQWLRDAVATVLADFPEGDSVELTVTPSRQADGAWWWLIGEGNRAYGGLQLPAEPTEAEILAEIAWYVQERVFDTEPWGEARPVCPGHPHPPDPKVIDGKAVWICPRDGHVLAPIGQLR